MNQLLLGATAAVALTIGLFLMKFWRSTGDRFFVFFAAAFGLMAAVRLLLALVPHLNEREPLIYGLHLIAMLIIVFAIIDKNSKAKTPPKDEGQLRRLNLSLD